jgi:peroxiredoxin
MAQRVLFVLALVLACTVHAPVPSRDVQTLRAIELRTLSGESCRLDDLRHGRVALVSLWATWCATCAEELPALARLYERVRERAGIVIAIAVGEPRERVAQFVRDHAIPYPQLVDERFRFADAAGQSRVPATLVLDEAGRVVFIGGPLDEGAVRALEASLRDRPSARVDASALGATGPGR